MEKQYSVKFLTAFVENLQSLCIKYLDYDSSVEIGGYISVEIDNVKKERYVLSELLQSSGNVVSESFCVKAFKASAESRTGSEPLASSSSSFSTLESRDVTHRRHASTLDERGSSFSDRSSIHTEISVQSLSGTDVNRKIRSSATSQDHQPVCSQSTKGHLKRHANDDSLFTNPQQKVRQMSRRDESFPELPIRSEATIYMDNIEDEIDQVEELEKSFPQKMTEENFQYGESTHFSETSFDREEGSVRDSFASDEVIDLDLFDDDDEEEEEATASCPEGLVVVQDTYLKGAFSGDATIVNTMMENRMSPGSLCVMKSSIKQFQKYHCKKYGKEVDLLSTSPEELNEMLLDFYQGARTVLGQPLSAGSLKNVQTYIDKYMREKGYLYSISKDDHFKTSRGFLKSRLNERSKSLILPKHLPVADEDIELLFLKNQLGDSNPDAVMNSMWVLNSKFFAIRGPKDHFKFRWGDIALRVDNLGNEYLEHLGNPLATFTLKVHAKPENPSRCFVKIYKKFMATRPSVMLDPDSAFYLKPKTRARADTQAVWYIPEPLTWSSLTSLWKRMLISAGLPVNKKIY